MYRPRCCVFRFFVLSAMAPTMWAHAPPTEQVKRKNAEMLSSKIMRAIKIQREWRLMEARLKQFLNQASTFVSAAALAAVLVLPASAWSQSPNGPSKTEASPAAAGAYTLDGQKFSARIVRDGGSSDEKNRGLGDVLSFTDGKFSSEICRRYNFVDAPYWIRLEGNKVHFLAELKSPTDGTMRWQGTIRGDTLEGTMQWRRKRWYWTIDATHKIRGKLKKGVSSALPPSN